MDDQPTSQRIMGFVPAFLKNPPIWIPIMVAFYVGILGFCLTGALNRQKVSIKQVRQDRSAAFSMLDEDEDADENDNKDY